MMFESEANEKYESLFSNGLKSNVPKYYL